MLGLPSGDSVSELNGFSFVVLFFPLAPELETSGHFFSGGSGSKTWVTPAHERVISHIALQAVLV